MKGPSSLHRFIKASRDFGFAVAVRVAYSKIRGLLYPALVLPGASNYDAAPREVSFLVSSAHHEAASISAIVEVIDGRDLVNWEICICERRPVPPDVAQILARYRGTRPWIRVVMADEPVAPAVADRWTVEQATGEFVAFVAPAYVLEPEAIGRLVVLLHQSPSIVAAALVDGEQGSADPRSAAWSDCHLLLQRKSAYLLAFPDRWPLTAPTVAKALEEARIHVEYVSGQHISATGE